MPLRLSELQPFAAGGVSGAPMLLGLTALLVSVALAGGGPVLLSGRLARRSALVGLGQAAATGVFLGGGLVHMLPDAVAHFAGTGLAYPWPFMVCGAAMLFLAMLEAVAQVAAGGRANEATPLVAALVLGVHSVLAGAALGATSHAAALLLVFLALVAHKGAASFSLTLLLARSRLARPWAWAVFLIFVACLPAGVALGRFAVEHERAQPMATAMVLAMGAGTFLYLGAMHGAAAAPRSRPADILARVAGFALMALVAAVV